jgi:hypothetical protein
MTLVEVGPQVKAVQRAVALQDEMIEALRWWNKPTQIHKKEKPSRG